MRTTASCRRCGKRPRSSLRTSPSRSKPTRCFSPSWSEITAGSRHLVLVGGGHAHVHVLRGLARRPDSRLRVTLVSPARRSTYSGMVPGYLAGLYRLEDAQVDVAAMAKAAGVAFVEDRVAAIDHSGGRLHLVGGSILDYEFVSFDIGSRPTLTDRLADDAPVALVKPIERAAEQIEEGLRASGATSRFVVVGAGAGGTEIAFAIAARLRDRRATEVVLLDRGEAPVAERGARVARLVGAALRDKGIEFRGGADVEHVDAAGVHLAGEVVRADLVVWSTGAAAPSLFAAAGLATDERGFVRVEDDLRVVGVENVFAVGDCATMTHHPRLPKAGVYAVRQGPVLDANLRALVRGEATQPFRPQKRFLAILNLCDGEAIASYAGFAWRGRLAWWCKDRIDRGFVESFAVG